mmetsp:Transcript_25330/g.73063  ORF Transcript_25330/g.73063 Transcript_25330/m.73063 type:complete len:94 (-) Transcript_25330:172-453(-)
MVEINIPRAASCFEESLSIAIDVHNFYPERAETPLATKPGRDDQTQFVKSRARAADAFLTAQSFGRPCAAWQMFATCILATGGLRSSVLGAMP